MLFKTIAIFLLLGFIVLLSILDLGANLLSFLPFIGVVFESLAELILELLQIFAAIILAVIAWRSE